MVKIGCDVEFVFTDEDHRFCRADMAYRGMGIVPHSRSRIGLDGWHAIAEIRPGTFKPYDYKIVNKIENLLKDASGLFLHPTLPMLHPSLKTSHYFTGGHIHLSSKDLTRAELVKLLLQIGVAMLPFEIQVLDYAQRRWNIWSSVIEMKRGVHAEVRTPSAIWIYNPETVFEAFKIVSDVVTGKIYIPDKIISHVYKHLPSEERLEWSSSGHTWGEINITAASAMAWKIRRNLGIHLPRYKTFNLLESWGIMKERKRYFLLYGKKVEKRRFMPNEKLNRILATIEGGNE